MARKTRIPPELLSRIGKDLILSSRNGVPYVKRYARPKNPNTAAQRKSRSALARAVHAWQATDPKTKARWNEAAWGKSQSGYTLFISEFIAKDVGLPD
jgi:hypothetical protein